MRRALLVVHVCVLALLPISASAQSTTEDGIRAIVRGDYPAGARILEPLAGAGPHADPVAQFFLALLYHTGHGVAGDQARACGLFLSAAGREHPLAEPSRAIAAHMRDNFGLGARLCVADESRTAEPPVPSAIPSIAMASGAKATTADGIVALVRGEYQRAIEILKPIAEHWQSEDSAAQFFVAGLYASGRGVPADPLRACALYMRSSSKQADPIGYHASLLFTAAVWARGPEFDADCQRLAVVGFDHGFERTTFDLGPGHSVEWTLGAATLTYDYVIRREEQMFAAPGARFLPVQYTALPSGPTRSLVRHFVEIFVWQSSPRNSWTLQWHVLEIIRDQIVRIHVADALATADGDAPPSRDGFDVRQYAVVRLDDEGHPEWAVLKGRRPTRERIESEAERREVRDATAARKAAMERVDWNERYDVYRHPASVYADADGCGRFQLYGWTADRAEAFVVRVDAAALNLETQPTTFELSRHPVDISAHAFEYGGPQRQFDFCSDVSTPQPAGSIGPEVWRAVSGSVTIELSAPGVRAHALHLRRVTLTLRSLVLENARGTRISVAQPVRLVAIAGNPSF